MKVSRSRELKGLCKSCAKAGACALPRASRMPVLECESYEAFKPVQSRGRDRTAGGVTSKQEGEYRGLCSDCELRGQCTFPKPESGVWHCEYYR